MSNEQRNRRTPDGKGLGIVFFVLGLLGTIIAYILIQINGSVPRLFLLGPPLVLLGITMFVLPGSREVSASDVGGWVAAAPWLHKLAWLASMIAGIYLGFRFLLGEGA